MYADYSYYKDFFAGTLIPAEEFPSLANKAERYVNYITMHRVKEVNDSVSVGAFLFIVKGKIAKSPLKLLSITNKVK